jgi:hypothetical protein
MLISDEESQLPRDRMRQVNNRARPGSPAMQAFGSAGLVVNRAAHSKSLVRLVAILDLTSDLFRVSDLWHA